MDELRVQIKVLADEMNLIRSELVASKQAHAGLHQTTVEDRQNVAAKMTDQLNRLAKVEEDIKSTVAGIPGSGGNKDRQLIEPKQVTVPEFAGAISDSRAKSLEWSEKVHDRVGLYSREAMQALVLVEVLEEAVTMEISQKHGVGQQASHQLHEFLKDRTVGTANEIARSNKSGIGLETWRLLAREFNPRTIQGTLTAQHHEYNPRGATTMSDVPKCLLEWERSLRRCAQEGRKAPDDEVKCLTLLKMLPAKQRTLIWSNANQLYPN